ncbi:Oxidoreductase family, NAD-binding Rossmann fold [Mariniphaga anaerophila]|uniref:Oxidoreductase family, NAD-binding Rossmann fold n=1 Tax=Mariniphaga anaerophila TaxID=1484053 RepID=A0A1M5FXK3_9BACT|nr:Gfo/Idh/MocA family oxidoreductase [Mariniphaga anaerophila]SHF96179.1 Oxidoreductase family, NAD-binding Rossmann fold [Mariniphaga anaerophila]
MDKKKNTVSRRAFIGSTVSVAAGMTILPSHVVAGLGHQSPSDKLNIAGIGVGGYGYVNLRNMETENIVALCDVDWSYAGNTFKRWPMAKQYKDFRVMLEEQKDIDAVVIATPDHTHALAAVSAIREGKHVFVQQPLAHSVYESRILAETAERYGVATQMGNQGNSGEGIRKICEWIWAGTIGEITHVDAWTTRPNWPQNNTLPNRGKRVPRDLDWDLFVGPASWREYNPAYHPFMWRSFWNFGSGALGDMGAHILDPVFKALLLQYPESVEASSSQFNTESLPDSEFVRFHFPRRDNLPKVAMPEVSVNWYDGGWMPPRPEELADGEMMGDDHGGCIFYGTRGKIMCGAFAKDPTLLPTGEMDHFQEPAKSIRRIFNPFEGGHEQDWVRACKEPKETRLKASSHFGYAGPLNELIMLGVLAVRMQGLNRKLIWDGPNMRFANIGSSDVIRILSESNFEISHGKPRTNSEYATLSAIQTVEEWIRHSYRQGWEQI